MESRPEVAMRDGDWEYRPFFDLIGVFLSFRCVKSRNVMSYSLRMCTILRLAAYWHPPMPFCVLSRLILKRLFGRMHGSTGLYDSFVIFSHAVDVKVP